MDTKPWVMSSVASLFQDHPSVVTQGYLGREKNEIRMEIFLLEFSLGQSMEVFVFVQIN